MKFAKNDFSEMLYNIYEVPRNGLKKKFPNLYTEEVSNMELKQGQNKERVIRYIVYMYDPKSPVRSIPDAMKRKREAAILAGFTLNKSGTFSTNDEDVFLCDNISVNACILRFCINCKSGTYTSLITYEQALRNVMFYLLKNLPEPKHIKAAEDLRIIVDDLSHKLLGEDDNNQLRRHLYQFVDSDSINISPEIIAEKVNRGEEPINESEI